MLFRYANVQNMRKLLTETPWSGDLSEKLTVSQIVKKFPAFYGNRKFITALTNVFFVNCSQRDTFLR